MDGGTYRLTFRGELLDGSDPAHARAELMRLLKLDEARIGTLFSGQPVVVRRGADRDTAARFQQLFRQAGARLRVAPEADDAVPGPAPVAPAAAERPAPSAPPASPVSPTRAGKPSLAERLAAEAAAVAPPAPVAAAAAARGRPATGAPARAAAADPFTLAPAGSDLLRAEERATVVAPTLDLGHLSAALPEDGILAGIARPAPPPPPDTSALRLDAVGVRLVAARPEVVVELDLSGFSLAEPGGDLGVARGFVPREVDTSALQLAEVGATLAPPAPPPPPPPDVSHLAVQRERARFGAPD